MFELRGRDQHLRIPQFKLMLPGTLHACPPLVLVPKSRGVLATAYCQGYRSKEPATACYIYI
ncbi:hypothetical protein HaLaN_30518 [Haematococcus lacustris]|uniref:Uncharacterized protein n=1 Tax=Haematococcus lacustris TaxID=44745 RepID=A0A6A0AGN6_HAELA|nr:hypothetical protein HaLaN_30518 [Haematococcus lacustris]